MKSPHNYQSKREQSYKEGIPVAPLPDHNSVRIVCNLSPKHEVDCDECGDTILFITEDIIDCPTILNGQAENMPTIVCPSCGISTYLSW